MYYAIMSEVDYGDGEHKELHGIVSDKSKAIEMVNELNASIKKGSTYDISFCYEAHTETLINLSQSVLESKYYKDSFLRQLPNIIKSRWNWWNTNKERCRLSNDYAHYMMNDWHDVKIMVPKIGEERMRYLINTLITLHGVGK